MTKPNVTTEEMRNHFDSMVRILPSIARDEQCEICEAIRALIEHGPEVDRPTIVCLCGSTRFMDAFFDAGWAETLAGKIVLSIGVCKHAEDHSGEALGPETVRLLDELHLRKIDLADEVFILNVGGYIGESTRNELNYAKERGKKIRFLEPPEAGVTVKED